MGGLCVGIVICNEDTSCFRFFSAVISSSCSIAASTNRYRHLNLSLSFSGGVGGGVCIVVVHTLAVADDGVIDADDVDDIVENGWWWCCLMNIGLVLDMSNGTSEEEE